MKNLRKPIVLVDEWKMGIEITVPMAVQHGNFVFTRGQIDIDDKTRVLNPADAVAQTRTCASHVARTLKAAETGADRILHLNHYYRAGSVDDPGKLAKVLLAELRAPVDTPITLIPVPHFYFDGIEVETDAIALASRQEPSRKRGTPLDWVAAAQDGQLAFFGGSTRVEPQSTDRIWSDVAQYLGSFAPSTGRMRLYIQAPNIETYRALLEKLEIEVEGWALHVLPCITPGVNDIAVSLTGSAMLRGSGCWISDNRGVPWLLAGNGLGFVDAILPSDRPQPEQIGKADALARQARSMMDDVGARLASHGLGFSNVLKATTYYRGRDSAEDLYANLSVRDSYYSYPGPASTGVPFLELDRQDAELLSSLVLALPGQWAKV